MAGGWWSQDDDGHGVWVDFEGWRRPLTTGGQRIQLRAEVAHGPTRLRSWWLPELVQTDAVEPVLTDVLRDGRALQVGPPEDVEGPDAFGLYRGRVLGEDVLLDERFLPADQWQTARLGVVVQRTPEGLRVSPVTPR